MAKHVVQQGETITSIGFAYGFFPGTLWDLDENAALRELRGNPDILLAGDEVFIPDKRVAHVAAATGKQHTFRRLGVPAKTRLQLFAGTQPRANEPYTLVVDGKTTAGTLGADGLIEAFIPPDAVSAQLTVGGEMFTIAFGALDPITEESGIRQRLVNLGLMGNEPPALALEIAVRRLQRLLAVDETGIVDDATRDGLAKLHDAPAAAT